VTNQNKNMVKRNKNKMAIRRENTNLKKGGKKGGIKSFKSFSKVQMSSKSVGEIRDVYS
jgi:hypothetical protein